MERRAVLFAIGAVALGGCTSGGTDPGTQTPTPTETDETPTPPPVDSAAKEDLALENERDEAVEGTVVIDTGDETEKLEFDLEPFEDETWEEVPLLRRDAEITTHCDGESATYEWSGSREDILVIFLDEDEIRYEIVIP